MHVDSLYNTRRHLHSCSRCSPVQRWTRALVVLKWVRGSLSGAVGGERGSMAAVSRTYRRYLRSHRTGSAASRPAAGILSPALCWQGGMFTPVYSHQLLRAVKPTRLWDHIPFWLASHRLSISNDGPCFNFLHLKAHADFTTNLQHSTSEITLKCSYIYQLVMISSVKPVMWIHLNAPYSGKRVRPMCGRGFVNGCLHGARALIICCCFCLMMDTTIINWKHLQQQSWSREEQESDFTHCVTWVLTDKSMAKDLASKRKAKVLYLVIFFYLKPNASSSREPADINVAIRKLCLMKVAAPLTSTITCTTLTCC